MTDELRCYRLTTTTINGVQLNVDKTPDRIIKTEPTHEVPLTWQHKKDVYCENRSEEHSCTYEFEFGIPGTKRFQDRNSIITNPQFAIKNTRGNEFHVGDTVVGTAGDVNGLEFVIMGFFVPLMESNCIISPHDMNRLVSKRAKVILRAVGFDSQGRPRPISQAEFKRLCPSFPRGSCDALMVRIENFKALKK